MKCVYCSENLEGMDYTSVAAHKRRCGNLRRIYTPLPKPLVEQAKQNVEAKLAGYIIGHNVPAMAGKTEGETIMPVEASYGIIQLPYVDYTTTILAMIDDMDRDLDIIEKELLLSARKERSEDMARENNIGPKPAQNEKLSYSLLTDLLS